MPHGCPAPGGAPGGLPGFPEGAFLRRLFAAPARVARCGPVMPVTRVVTPPGAQSAAPGRNGRPSPRSRLVRRGAQGSMAGSLFRWPSAGGGPNLSLAARPGRPEFYYSTGHRSSAPACFSRAAPRAGKRASQPARSGRVPAFCRAVMTCHDSRRPGPAHLVARRERASSAAGMSPADRGRPGLICSRPPAAASRWRWRRRGPWTGASGPRPGRWPRRPGPGG